MTNHLSFIRLGVDGPYLRDPSEAPHVIGQASLNSQVTVLPGHMIKC